MKTDRFLLEELQKIHAVLKQNLSEAQNELDSSLHFKYEDLNLLELLNHINCEKIFYFKSKYTDFTYLGLGHSQTIKARDLDSFLERHPQHFLVAPFLFEQDPLESVFILPEWIFVSQSTKTDLIINKSYEYKNFSSPNLFFSPQFDLNLYDPFIPPWQSYEEFPEHDEWIKIIAACDTLFEKDQLEKIVLSRKKIFDYDSPIDPIAFFKAVMKHNNQALGSYSIFHQISFGEAFISLTPEKLFSLKDNLFESIALAASAPRGIDEAEDRRFEELLVSSEKLIREHNLVTEEIVRKITPLSESLTLGPLQTMKLPYIQHRSIQMSAKLHSPISALDLVTLLHPTPAVGGLPWDQARMKIAELEPYERGYYAAPIGVVNYHLTELAVGIRSAFIEQSRLTLFGGAGIVKGSTADEEWNETGVKMNPFLKVVNHE